MDDGRHESTQMEHRRRDSHGGSGSLGRTAAVATLHCLTGCAIGEVLGLAIGTALGLSNTVTIVIAILLAFLFGYALTMLPLLRSGLALPIVLPLALTSDTFSITVMEIVDNVIMVVIPGAMDAGLDELLFWGSLALALGIAFLVAWPVNRWLIARGRGHAVVHDFHHGDRAQDTPPPKLHVGRLAVIGITAIALTVGVGVAAAQIAENTGSDSEQHGTVHVDRASIPIGGSPKSK
ncbi:MAG: DUF4396 domain-containing protein [Verrucomicrobiota bacterium]